MCDETGDCKCCCCVGPQGPQGIPGIQGVQGIQGPSGQDGRQGSSGPQGAPGPQGPAGVDGQMGPQGLQGIIGSMGPQGLQGLQGIPGKDCEKDCCHADYLTIYSDMNQIVPAASSPVLNTVAIGTTAFDTSLASSTGEVKVLKHGIYFVNWGFDGLLTPPYPSPIPGWSLGIYKNGVLVPSSTSGAFSITPDDLCIHISADFIAELFVGDVLKIVNLSTSSINAVATFTGSTIPVAAARMNINLIKALV
jgi:hypothetical protein